MGLLHSADIDKNCSSLLLTLCGMLGADMFTDLLISDATALVFPCQPGLDDISNHPFIAFNVKKGTN